MESENPKSFNSRPTASSSLPGITLAVLLAMILALLYIGYEYMADDTGGSEELTNVPLDTADQRPLAMQTEPDLIAPEEDVDDTATSPAPVDLSQAEPPADETIASKPAVSEEKPQESAKVAVADREKPRPEPEKPTVTTAEKKTEAPKLSGSSRTHTVEKGETFYGVANRYNLKVSTLKALNPGVAESDVKAGVTKLNVKVRAVHTVGPGDVLRVVAEKYGVSKEALMRANGKTKDFAQRGEKLIIPYPEKQ